MNTLSKKIKITALAVSLGLSLSACSNTVDRLSNVGSAPEMTRVENPQLRTDYRPVSMPMPAPKTEVKQPNSLWSTSRKNFFDDQRAGEVGDILTVMIDIQDEAQLENETERTRGSSEGAELPALAGYEAALNRILPEAVDPGNLASFGSNSSTNGQGSIEREEEIVMKMAAVITQVLPNGNFVIQGSQEVRVNFEKRILNVTGVIRPQDISINNTINHDQIAEARIVYGGEGHITDVQQARYGQQVYDILFPF